MMIRGRRLCSTSSELMRLVCAVRSCISRASSRCVRRASSSSGVGSCNTDHTRSPAWWRSSIVNSLSPSSRSVLARLARRFTSMLAASTTMLSMPCSISQRCSHQPSRPAS